MKTLKWLSIFSLAAVFAVAQPAFAQSHGGHGSSGGGGAHVSGGGAHVSGGGGHFSGGSRSSSAPHFGGYGGGYGGGYSGVRSGYAPSRFTSAHAYYGGGRLGSATQYGTHRANGYVTGYNRAGFGRTGGYGHTWHGGYWGGRYWPGSGFRAGFSWFLPILPLGFATYWWGGLPYYYYDDAYYTWNQSYNGYVATDPPPVAQDSQSSDNGSNDAVPPADSYQGSSDVFAYPKNGQSTEQAAKDRSECRAWAVGETGFDPSHASSSAAQSSTGNYQRAMGACLDARGYSTR